MAENVVYTITLNDLLSGKLRDAEGNAVRLDSRMSDLSGTVNKLGTTIAAAFAVDKIMDFGRSTIEAGTKVENALSGLTTLLRDSGAAAQVVSNTMEDATKTPFGFESLLDANKALISANVSAEDARQTVIDLANAIAATGGGDDELSRMVVNLQQIKNVGAATAADVKQFAMAGVNIYQVLADATGKPVEKVKDLTISYDMLAGALRTAASEGGIYAGALDNIAGNTSVQISNLGDAVFQLQVKMFNDLKPAIDTVVAALSSFIEVLAAGWDWLVRNKDTLSALAIGMGVAATAIGTYSLVTNAAAIATGLVTVATWAWNVALNASPLGWLFTALTLVTTGIVLLWRNVDTFRANIMGVWGVLKEFGNIVADVFSGVGKVIAGVLTFDPSMVVEGANQTISAISDSGKRMGEAFEKGYQEGIDNAKKGKEEKATTTATAPATVGAKTAPKMTAAASPAAGTTKSSSGTKNVSINIKIDNLIRQFSVSTTNLQESTAKIREVVVQTLLSSVKDSQIVAGQ